MNVLAIEPYYGGSHKAFLDGVTERSRHRWGLATLAPRHWKWRMRSAPVAILGQVAEVARTLGKVDVLFASDMLDLPTFLGFAARHKQLAVLLSGVPTVAYFHENQWAYPTAPEAPVDHHYGFTNLLTASVSDQCWFNSAYNRDSFLQHASDFLRRMPDSQAVVDLEQIESNSHLVPPGFLVPSQVRRQRPLESPIRLGWVGRFEHDKRPDRFLELLRRLEQRGIEFELVLLGQRGRSTKVLNEIRSQLSKRIRFDRFADSRADYESQLTEIDVVISTADHEFFGIAMCEAIWAGAVPVTPNGLSYTEYIPDSLRFDSLEQAADLIGSLNGLLNRSPDGADEIQHIRQQCKQRIEPFCMPAAVELLDSKLDQIHLQ